MSLGAGDPLGLELGGPGVDDAAVFAVYPHQPPQGLEGGENVIELPVGDLVAVGEIELEGADPFPEHLRQLHPDVRPPFRDGHMEAVITAALPVRLVVPVLEALGQGLPLLLCGEVHNAGGASQNGGLGARLKVVGGDGAADGQVHMGVGVDHAGQHQQPLGIHHLRPQGGEISAHAEDFFSLQQQIQRERALLGDNRAPANQCFHFVRLLIR